MRIRDRMDTYPVTSGGKGIHVYARLPRPVSPDAARTLAKEIATRLSREHPDTITATMAKTHREQRIFIDWSQNSGSKTTLSPYSLRGREQPWVAAPRTWDELDDPGLDQLLYTDVLDRVDERGDLLDGLDDDYPASGPPSEQTEVHTPSPPTEDSTGTDDRQVINLREYRRKRDAAKTPEPFGDESHQSRTAQTLSLIHI